jgi:hypothetical protein
MARRNLATDALPGVSFTIMDGLAFDGQSMATQLKETHDYLFCLVKCSGPHMEQYWQSFDEETRTACLGPLKEMILRDLHDENHPFHDLMPELNMHELINPKSDVLLELVNHRGRTFPACQCRVGRENDECDFGFVYEKGSTAQF